MSFPIGPPLPRKILPHEIPSMTGQIPFHAVWNSFPLHPTLLPVHFPVTEKFRQAAA